MQSLTIPFQHHMPTASHQLMTKTRPHIYTFSNHTIFFLNCITADPSDPPLDPLLSQLLLGTQRRSRLQHGYCIGVSRRSAQATVSKGLAQGPYVAARAGVEPTTLRLRVVDLTNAPPRPTW